VKFALAAVAFISFSGPASAQDACASLKQAIDAAPDGFRTMRTTIPEGPNAFVSSLTLPGYARCSVIDVQPPGLGCHKLVVTESIGNRILARDVASLRVCLSGWEEEPPLQTPPVESLAVIAGSAFVRRDPAGELTIGVMLMREKNVEMPMHLIGIGFVWEPTPDLV
jgi:hypothetical protein